MIQPFPDHPFKVKDDAKLQDLSESIKRNGVLHPALLLPLQEQGGFYYIAGHRRGLACEKAGLISIPSIIKDISFDEAVILMADSNLQQRDDLLPSEKAFAYKMKLDAMKRQGNRSDLTCGQVDHKLDGMKTRDIIAEQSGESAKQISRYIRLTYLIEPFLDRVDSNKMAFSPAVAISYLSVEQQEKLLEIMVLEEVSPSLEQAEALKAASQVGALEFEDIYKIMKQEKANQHTKYSIKGDRIQQYLPKDATPKEVEETIIKALEFYQKHLQRKRQQER